MGFVHVNGRQVLLFSITFIYTYLIFTYEKEKINVRKYFSPVLQNISDDNSLETLHKLLANEVIRSLDEVDNVRKFVERRPKLRAKGVLLALARNSELDGMIHTVKQIETSFNRQYNYPYLFLNDEPFTEEFKTKIRKLASETAEFGLIPKEHWSVPDWINRAKFSQSLQEMSNTVSYGGLESYRHMCRFNSGFFYKHPLIQKYDYYWRIEPNVDYPCKMNYDPFLFMKISRKKYGFNVIAAEEMRTVQGLWDVSVNFMKEKKITDAPLFRIFGDSSFNGVHYWSNFEIGDLRWLRSREYNDYFDYVDKAGGFFYSRWGDAPVHSLAVGILLKPHEVHYFGDIGYKHDGCLTCPIKGHLGNLDKRLACSCDIANGGSLYEFWSRSSALSYFKGINKLRHD